MGKFRYRAYLDGIRGLAVISVVLFHTNIEVFREGFLGVDVFFVLSGYLITSVVVQEIKKIGTVDVIRFYARRARRILPGATINLLIVTLFDVIFVPTFLVRLHESCLKAASTYWANICFLKNHDNYWDHGGKQSPVTHYWSLSIEEQFYFFYPFILFVTVSICMFFNLVWKLFKYCLKKCKRLLIKSEEDSFEYQRVNVFEDEIVCEDDDEEKEDLQMEEFDRKEQVPSIEDKKKEYESQEEEEEGGEEVQEKEVPTNQMTQESQDIQEEEQEEKNLSKEPLFARLPILVILLVVVIASVWKNMNLIRKGDVTQSHLSSFGRCYQLGFGGILSIILDLIIESKYGICSCCCYCSNRCSCILRVFYGILSFIFLICGLGIISYPLLPFFNNFHIYPSISGMIITVLTFCLIFFIECEMSRERSIQNEGFICESKSLARHILQFPVLVYVGKWSYSIYLYHFPLIIFGDMFLILPQIEGGIVSEGTRVIIICVLSLILGVISYYFVERVFMRIKIDGICRKCCCASCVIIVPLTTFSIIMFLTKLRVERKILDVDDIIIDPGKNWPFFHPNTTYGNVTFQNGTNITNNIEDDDDDEGGGPILARRWAVYGDSMVRGVVDMCDKIAEATNTAHNVTWSGGMPCFDVFSGDVDRIGRQDMWKSFWIALQQLPDYLVEFKPDVVFLWSIVIQGNWVLYGFLDPDRWEANYLPPDLDGFIYREYTQFLRKKIDPIGAHVVHFLPQPAHVVKKWTKPAHVADPKYCLVANGLLEGESDGKICDFNVDHLKTYPSVVTALERVAKERKNNYTLINIDEFVCPDGICPAKYKGYSVYDDKEHLSRDFWILKVNEFIQLLAEHNIYFVDKDL